MVFYTAAPNGTDDAAYRAIYVDGLRHVLEALVHQRQAPQRVLLTSSTAVYAQSTGAWIDETSPAEPAHFTGRRVLEGERLLLDGPFPATVIRFGGIYGPGRTSLIERVRQGVATCRDGPPLYTNRIHRDDCAWCTPSSDDVADASITYIGVDHEPADYCDLLRWLAVQLGAPPPRVEVGLAPTAAAIVPTSAAAMPSWSRRAMCSDIRPFARGIRHCWRHPAW